MKSNDTIFRRQMLDKHSQLMRMHLRYNCMERAKEEFKNVKLLFTLLHEAGESMKYYTPEDFAEDLKRFEK